MLRSYFRPLAVVLLSLLGLGLLGTSCQQTAEDCNETLSCPSTGGTHTTGGTEGMGAAAGQGGQGGLGGGQGGDGGADTGTGGTQPCDPTQEACGGGVIVHVSPSGYDEDSGSKITPVKTVAEALTRVATAAAAGEEKLLVYLCTTEGAFEETLSIGPAHNGVGIFGGFDCATFEPIEERAVIMADEPSGHRIQDTATVTLGDVRLESPDASAPGASSIALTVVDSTGVRILRSEIVAGEGADGEAGMGYAAGERAEQGEAGNGGNDACVVDNGSVNEGGEPATTQCGGVATLSVGGSGGPGGISSFTGGNGSPGEPDGGAFGTGQTAGSPCTNGDNGDDGGPGDHGPASATVGTLNEGAYSAPVGGSGMPGVVGEGGGGGGGANRASCVTGASGGSGGGGGCPGAGAAGGQGGGGSFGLVSVSSEVELSETSIEVALGGVGGAGGNGQLGGNAGVSAAGGEPGIGDGSAACDGGKGGLGGRGGSGGGGAGGPSIVVAYVGTVPSGLADVTFKRPSSGAPGGPGGVLNADGNAPNGTVADSRAF